MKTQPIVHRLKELAATAGSLARLVEDKSDQLPPFVVVRAALEADRAQRKLQDLVEQMRDARGR